MKRERRGTFSQKSFFSFQNHRFFAECLQPMFSFSLQQLYDVLPKMREEASVRRPLSLAFSSNVPPPVISSGYEQKNTSAMFGSLHYVGLNISYWSHGSIACIDRSNRIPNPSPSPSSIFKYSTFQNPKSHHLSSLGKHWQQLTPLPVNTTIEPIPNRYLRS